MITFLLVCARSLVLDHPSSWETEQKPNLHHHSSLNIHSKYLKQCIYSPNSGLLAIGLWAHKRFALIRDRMRNVRLAVACRVVVRIGPVATDMNKSVKTQTNWTLWGCVGQLHRNFRPSYKILKLLTDTMWPTKILCLSQRQRFGPWHPHAWEKLVESHLLPQPWYIHLTHFVSCVPGWNVLQILKYETNCT